MVELEYNPDFIGEKPNIERIIFKFGENWLTELLSGNVDAAIKIPTQEVIKLGKDPRYHTYYEFNVTNAFTIIWNHESPLFRDPAVRRALTLAINRKELIQVLNLPEIRHKVDHAMPGRQITVDLAVAVGDVYVNCLPLELP